MSWENYDDVVAQLQAAGLVIDFDRFAVDTPRPIRCRVDDSADREKRGWYWLSSIQLENQDNSLGDYIVGSFGVWRGPDNGKQDIKISRKQAAISQEEREAIRARQKEQARRVKAMRAAEIRRAADHAAWVWKNYQQDGDSDYLHRKGVGAHGIRFSPSGNGTFAVPMADAAGRIWGLQIIRGQGGRKLQKEYFPNGLDKKGHFHLIGAPTPGGILLLAEGYATAATLQESTGLPVAVAYDAGNLLPVAQELVKAYKGARILVCADDDYRQKCQHCKEPTEVAQEACQHCGEPHGQKNPGIVAADNAAKAVSGAVVHPRFPDDRNGEKLTDFNDLANFPSGGNHLVRAQVDEAIAASGWKASAAPLRMEPIKGGGEGSRRQAASVMALDDAIDRFWPIDDGTGKYLWDTWTRKVVNREQMMAVLPPGIRGDDVKRHPVWIQRGAVYIDQIGFDPTEHDSDVLLNTWRGWPMTPHESDDCAPMIDLINYLCSGDDNAAKVAEWLIQWMAYPLQHPGAKMSSAVIMHGPQGTGKSLLFQTLARIYGDYSTVLNQRGLEDKFNADWTDSKLFILAEEVVTRAEMWHIKNELKELVTGEWIRINPKNVAAYRQRNCLNIVYNSNEGQPLPLDNDDRRHLVIWTPPKAMESFYDEIWEWLEKEDGVRKFYRYLLNVDLAGFHPKKRPPDTQAKADLIDLSKPSEQRFVDEWIAGESDYPFCPCEGRQLYQAYSRWCRENGVKHPRESNQFLGYVHRQDGWSNAPRRLFDSTHYTGEQIRKRIVMPPVSILERHRAQLPQDKTQAQWLTDAFFRFKDALDGNPS